MRISDRTGSRAARLRSLLRSEGLGTVERRGPVRYYTFGAKPRVAPTLPGDTLDLNEDATDISAALRELQLQKDRQNIRAGLLLTDGAYTLGQNPLYEAEKLGIPLYIVGIGDSAEPRDISISRVNANDVVYSGSRTPVDLVVKSSEYGGERVEVTLTEGTRELDRTTVVLREGTQEYPLRLSYAPVGDGIKKLVIKVSTLPEEVTAANNQRTFMVKVLKSKLNVLLLAGAPSPDCAIIRQTFTEQPTLSVTSYTQKKDGGFYEGSLAATARDSADCLVMIDFPTSATNSFTLDQIKRLIEDRYLPVFIIAGKSVDVAGLTIFGAVIPFTVTRSGTAEEYILTKPEDDQQGNPLLEIGTDRGFDAWKRLPPIYRRVGVYQPKPGAVVLATSIVQNVPTGEPLILTRSVGRQKSLAVTGYGIWRWRLMGLGDGATEHLLDDFLHAAILWLTSPEDARRFRVSPTKESFSQGEPVEFGGQLYNASAQPVDDAHIRLVVKKGDQVVETSLRSIGNGRYEGAIEGLNEGEYVYSATGEWRSGTLGQESGKFSVGGMDLEFRNVRMNIELLQQLAYRTGGQYLAPEEISKLDSVVRAKVSFAPRPVVSTTELELWHWQYMLALLVLLLAAEWLLRKWHGML